LYRFIFAGRSPAGKINPMKYTPSALVSEFSGAQGSTVASHNRFGPYFRNRTIPINPNTGAQVAVRNTLKAASQAWRALTDAQRAAWEAVAATIPKLDALGRTYFQTGQEFYVSTQLAVKQYSAAAAFTTDPAGIVTPIDLVSFTPTATAGIPTFSIAYTATPLAANTKLVVYTTMQLSAGIQFVNNSLKRQIFLSAAAAASPANVLAAYNAMFGTLVAAKKIGISARVISSTGGRSNTQQTIISVGA
jgi:hypothetical protein